MKTAKVKLLQTLEAAIADQTFVKLTLGAPRGADASLKKWLARPVVLRDGPRVSCVWRHTTQDVTKNLEATEALHAVEELLGSTFGSAHLFTTTADLQLELARDGKERLSTSAPSHGTVESLAHDRAKQRTFVVASQPWLREVSVTTPDGKVKRGMEGKVRQIERFVEIFSHLVTPAIAAAAGRTLEVVDMGCGKGYLTFAIAEWLHDAGIAARVRGIDSRKELMASCEEVARRTGRANLHFAPGSISAFAQDHVDILIALHACDTATDEAIAKGIALGATAILVSPCCHKELRHGLVPPPELAPAFVHGIFAEREAEFVTDALRALLLEGAGFTTKVFEYVTSEHTAKNLMIAATRPSGRPSATIDAGASRRLASRYGIKHQRLASLLGVELAP